MFFMEYQYGKTQSIWAETTEKWDDTHPSWKTVGASPRRVSKECYGGEGLPLDRPRRASIENLFVCESVYYTVVFPSGREAIGCSRAQHRVGEHVIVEADRGEDCAAIRERLQVGDGRGAEQAWCARCARGPRPRADEQGWPLHGRCACSTGGLAKDAKKILRAATLQDVGILEVRKKQEASALEKCLGLVGEKGYPMEITRCEFQWDMRKITFYFRSSKRVDFRELVKELFKYFKIRIWMSMENRGGAEGKGSSSAAAAGVNGDISNS